MELHSGEQAKMSEGHQTSLAQVWFGRCERCYPCILNKKHCA